MADMLATTADLRTLLGEDATTLPDVQATLLLEMATAEVQAAAGQRIVEDLDDAVTLMGTTESWLSLPEQPVTDVTLVEIDGEAVTDYTQFGARLWRSCGWAPCPYEPSTVEVTYTHGYPDGHQDLELGRKLTLSLAAAMFANPDGVTGSFAIDDYREQMAQTGQPTNLLPELTRRLLRRTYGVRGGLVRVG